MMRIKNLSISHTLLLFLVFIPHFFVSAQSVSYKGELEKKEIAVEMCREALLILGDTLQFNPMFDMDHYWDQGTVGVFPSVYLLPTTFKGVVAPSNFKVKIEQHAKLPFHLKKSEGIEWLLNEISIDSLRESALSHYMATNPRLIKYDIFTLPDAPKTETLGMAAMKGIFKIEAPVISDIDSKFGFGLPDADRWVTKMTSALQFSQNYVSENWYQGGESNINIQSFQTFNIKRFDASKKTEFETTVNIRAGFYTTPSDTLRTFRVNDNLFQVNSKWGYKAFQRWYYTSALLFKTQLFNNYKANTNDLQAQFMSPAEMNLSLGMDYKYQNKKKTFEWSMLIAPLSYNLRYVANIKEIDEKRFGIEEGKHTLNQVGSSFNNELVWKLSGNVEWRSRLYFFSNYSKMQGDFENIFNFTINRYFSTRLSFHLRYDDDTKADLDLWQFREFLSFGFNFVW